MTTPVPPRAPKKRHWFRYFFSVLLLVLLVWGGVRACTGPKQNNDKKAYRIAFERIDKTVYISGDEARLQAFEKEIIRVIAKQQGFRIKMSMVSSDFALIGLESGKYDAVVTLLLPTENYVKEYLFSDPIYRLGAVLIVRSDSTATSLEQMEGKIVGIPRDVSTFFDVGTYRHLNVYSYDDGLDALNDLLINKIDGVIMNAWSAYVFAQGLYKGKIKVATNPFTQEGIRMVTLLHSRFAKNIPKFNQGLETLKQNGTYQDLLNKWGLIDIDITP